ncbi:MAG: proton-conducting transporter membrane subunit [Thiogranum sp.]|nr:proton-conducting transporter membrane subunit [Thiogranum sp.]
MSLEALLPLAILASSLVPGLLIVFLDDRHRRTRTWLNMIGATLKVLLVVGALVGVYHGIEYQAVIPMIPDYPLLLRLDPLALLFVSLSAALWLLTTVYAIAYLEGSPHRSRFFGFFSVCVSATVGIAMAGNLITLFFFYELLSLSTYPLVIHRETRKSLHAGRIYLAYVLSGSAVLLGAIVWLHSLAGPFEFAVSGGALDHVDPRHRPALLVIFLLMVGGFGVKAALVPMHHWLPIAMVAPAPVSALLHAVAVVKAGAFGIARTIYDVFGSELSHSLGGTWMLAIVAGVTIIYGSLRALQQDDLKRRLAYSTVSQLSYIILGLSLPGPLATIGALVHLVHQGIMKITLFFVAGNLAETLHLHKVSELDGVGWRMPWTMSAFTVAAFGMMSVPPLAGFISEWFLGLGALNAGAPWALGVLLVSSLLNAAYFLPVIYRAWFRSRGKPWHENLPRHRWETHTWLLIPPVITALLVIVLGLFANGLWSPLTWVRIIAEQEYPT